MAQKKVSRLIRFNRQNILEAAERLFAEKGVRQTTMDDIAKAAEYSKSTVYVYFKGKGEIYNSIIYTHMCALRDAANTCLEETVDFTACYFSICRSLTEFHDRYPLYFSSITGKIPVDAQALAESDILRRIYDVGEEINAAMALLFQRGMEEGVLRRGLSVGPTVFTLWAALGSLIEMAGSKEAYLAEQMGLSREEFLQYGFQMLLASVKKEA